jgi:hypothetical protein
VGKFSNTWSLMKASWQVLKKDKELLVFPVISGICCLIVLALFAVPVFMSGSWQPPARGASLSEQVNYYGLLFLFYFCNYFVIIFFNAAIVACAAIRMQGGDPTVRDGFRAAGARFSLIVGWALVSATIGLLLRIIEDRSEKIGSIIAALLGIAWSLMSFLVIPILVVEKKGPITAMKESTQLLKKTWGEQIIGNFSFGLVFFVLALPAIGLFAIAGFFASSAETLLPLFVAGGVALLYMIGLAVVNSALHTIFQTAVFLFARDNQVAPGFQTDLLMNAMRRK